MEAAGLEQGFLVGGWLIEPARALASRDGQSVALTPAQAAVLLALAERHGEAVDRKILRQRAFPGQHASDERLRATIASLRALFEDTPRRPRYIASVGYDAFALIAHFERPAPPPVPASTPHPQRRRGALPRLHGLLGELRRRHVLKVTGSYLLGIWIVLQVAEVTFAPLRFPDWWMTALTIIAVLGLPIVVALAWAYEITPQGIVADDGRDGTEVVHLPRARSMVAPAVVSVVALMAGVTGFAWWKTLGLEAEADSARGVRFEPAARSIAVLPLVDMSPGGGHELVGEGLSEELATRLAQVPGMRVAARTSAFEFKGRNVDVRRIGQALGVRHVLEGSVRRERDDVRVTVQLIDARNGYHVWAGNFDRPWRDVLVLQDEVARSVTAALKLVLDESASAADTYGDASRLDARALEPYIEGLGLLRRSADLSGLDDAARRFEAAIRIDPGFGRAYAALCELGVTRYRRSRDPSDLRTAEDACRKALEVSPGLLESERALAALYLGSGRHGAARELYTRLVGRDATNADGYVGLASTYEAAGDRAAAERYFRRAIEAEPAYWGSHNALGSFLFASGRSHEAAAAYARVTELAPSATAYNNLGAAMFMGGDLAGATRAYEHSLRLEPSSGAWSNLATSYYYLGRYLEAVQAYTRATTVAPHDHEVWGNLADAQWHVPTLRDEALRSYAHAVELAERHAELAGSAPLLLAQLGYYHCRIGQCPRGEAYLREAMASGADQMYVQYFAALHAAARGDAAGAERARREALRLGYPAHLLEGDPAFRTNKTPRNRGTTASS
jgi:TolB-like protein/Tfp pilus assembly protein PilF/DNA-binding winged helix-turn-helix (wHTH) protein